MGHMRITCLFSLLALSACGEAVQDNHFAEDVREERQADPAVKSEAVPVRIGELGPSFPACNAAGVARRLAEGETLVVRSAPFETAAEIGQISVGNRFFICTRSLDEKWLGIIYDENGDVGRCQVSKPVASRRAYEGPCRSGWVSGPFVKFIASAN
jgi:hypothetical protein